MLPQTILILSLALCISARPYPFANSTLAARQLPTELSTVVSDLPVAEILPVNDVPITAPVSVIPITAPVSAALPVTAPITGPISAALPITAPITAPISAVLPAPPSSSSPSSNSNSNTMSVGEASTTCGSSQLNCCNSLTSSNGIGIGVNCSPINILLIGAQVPLTTACAAKAACCQGDTTQSGLVNVGCLAVAGV